MTLIQFTGVIVLSAVANQFRLHKLDKVEKFVMSYGGLRGAVAFALVLLIDPSHVKLKNMFVTTTIAVIYFTVFIQVRIFTKKKKEHIYQIGNIFFHLRFPHESFREKRERR